MRMQGCCRQVVAAIVVGACMRGLGFAANPSEYDIKAAFLFNFTRFVTWPQAQPPPSRFRIGVFGVEPFSPGLANLLEGKSVDGRPIDVRSVSSAAEARECQLIWISLSEEHDLAEILSVLSGYPVLTVSDIPGFIRRGGMIGFEREKKRVRFSVNLAATDRAGMKISSDMLKLAKQVRGGTRTMAAVQ